MYMIKCDRCSKIYEKGGGVVTANKRGIKGLETDVIDYCPECYEGFKNYNRSYKPLDAHRTTFNKSGDNLTIAIKKGANKAVNGDYITYNKKWLIDNHETEIGRLTENICDSCKYVRNQVSALPCAACCHAYLSRYEEEKG